ncbi:transcriptional regulator [Cellulomonas uda]|uniref:Transcriptional regulator n=1 Tax=Cellulomonas uda TaxID=1714 RepID=A0A4Y3KE83_CELUD|nr:transcriptional regulator [Cellulomonas uda]
MFVREQELARVQRACDASEIAIVVRGPRGSGRSTFVREAVERLPRAFDVRANPTESSWPFAGISSLLYAIDDERWRHLALSLGSAPDLEVVVVAHRILTLLHEHDAPATVLLVDDADLLDPRSRAVVGFLARRLAGTGLRLVLLVESVPPELGGLDEVVLGPLDARRTRALVGHLAPARHHPAVLDVVAHRSGGSPADAVDLLAGLTPAQAAGSAPLELPLRPGRVEHVVRRFAQLPPAQAALVERLALAPRTHADDLGGGDELEVVDELVAAGWVARDGAWLSLTREPVRSAVFHSTSARRRREHHRRAVEHVSDPYASDWHASFVDPGPRAAEALRRAALGLLAEGSPDVAFEYVERSLLLAQPGARAADHLLVVAAAYFYRGHLEIARRYVDIAESVEEASPHSRLVVASLRVRIEYVATQSLLTALAERALELHGASAPDESVLLLALLATYSTERWELVRAAEYLARMDALLGVAHEPAHTVAESAAILFDAMSSARARSRSTAVAVQVGPNPSSTTALMTRARALTYAERYDEARDLFRTLLASPAAVDPLWVVTTRLYDADNDRLAGDLRAATATVAALVEQDELPHVHRPYRLFHELWYFHETGRPDRARACEDELLDISRGSRNPAISARVDAYLGARALHAGDLDEAARALMRCRMVSAGPPGPHLYRCDADLVEVLVRTGNTAAARTIVDDLARRSAAASSRWSALALARCRALLAPDDEAVRAFEDAAVMFGPRDSDYELARTLSAFAARLDAMGAGERAERVRDDAAATYRRIGLPWWAGDLVGADDDASLAPGAPAGPSPAGPGSSSPGQPGARSSVAHSSGARSSAARSSGAGASDARSSDLVAALSDAERDVVELVVAGLRNREIAARLFLSVRAVESRLTAIYRKVGVRSRAQLVSLLPHP